MRPQLSVLITAALAAFVPAFASGGVSPSATIVGTVTLTAADGETFPGQGARVTLACAADATTRTEVSDEHGAFRFSTVPVDTCSINADVQGFAAPPVRVVTVADQVVGSDLHLGIAPLRVGVNVGGTVPPQELKVPRRSCRSDAGRRLDRSSKTCTR
jgi:Carboxypeptidase regulatory-like domain